MITIIIVLAVAVCILIGTALLYCVKSFKWIDIADKQPQKDEWIFVLSSFQAEHLPSGVRILYAKYYGMTPVGLGEVSLPGLGLDIKYWYPASKLPPFPKKLKDKK
jgi:hypothetical protein